MTNKERLFQAVLFEVVAVFISAIFVRQVTPSHTATTDSVLAMLITISLMAMVWTFVYNLIFDKVFTGEKLARPVWLRVGHIVGFEGGLLVFTLPLVMWVLKIGLWQAFLLDMSLTVLILGYGFGFYWVYDWVRANVVNRH